MLAPVFYGYEDVTVPRSGTSDTAMRVFHPSLEGSPPNAPLLSCLGRYPLVLFLHGQCDVPADQDHRLWFRLPAALARSGFVVAVPDMGWAGTSPWATAPPQHATALAAIDWMYSSWSGRQWLGSQTTLALAGHSFGALLAGRLATEIPSSGLVSIGGGWAEWPVVPPVPIPNLPVPSAFFYGTNDIYAAQPTLIGQAPSPTHRVIFEGGEHWDYLDANRQVCNEPSGPCDLVDELTADLAVVYLSRLLRVASVPASLEPPTIQLTAEQMFYAGNHLTGLSALPRAGCDVTIEWSLPATGSVTLPWP